MCKKVSAKERRTAIHDLKKYYVKYTYRKGFRGEKTGVIGFKSKNNSGFGPEIGNSKLLNTIKHSNYKEFISNYKSHRKICRSDD